MFHTTIGFELIWNERRISEKRELLQDDYDARKEKLTIQVTNTMNQQKSNIYTCKSLRNQSLFDPIVPSFHFACRGTSQSGSGRQINSFTRCGLVRLPHRIISSHDKPFRFAKSGDEGKYQNVIYHFLVTGTVLGLIRPCFLMVLSCIDIFWIGKWASQW